MSTSAETARDGLAGTIAGARAAEKPVALRLVTFQIGEEEFGVDILSVREIHRMVELTRVPQAPAGVEGVINLRGTIVPVVDPRKRFGMPVRVSTASNRIVVVELPGRTVGMLVDRVRDVMDIESSVFQAAPEMVGFMAADCIAGVGRLSERSLILLDVERLFDLAERDGPESSGP